MRVSVSNRLEAKLQERQTSDARRSRFATFRDRLRQRSGRTCRIRKVSGSASGSAGKYTSPALRRSSPRICSSFLNLKSLLLAFLPMTRLFMSGSCTETARIPSTCAKRTASSPPASETQSTVGPPRGPACHTASVRPLRLNPVPLTFPRTVQGMLLWLYSSWRVRGRDRSQVHWLRAS